MHNFRVNRVDPESQRHNNRVLGEHMDSEHYIRWIYPPDMEPDTTSGVSPPTKGYSTLKQWYWVLGNSGAPALLWKTERPEQCRLGRIETVLVFSVSTTTTANHSTTLRGYLLKDGTDYGAMAATLSSNGTFPGPGTAATYTRFTFTGYLPITPEHYIIDWSIVRNTADASTADLRIHSVRHRYIPDQHEV